MAIDASVDTARRAFNVSRIRSRFLHSGMQGKWVQRPASPKRQPLIYRLLGADPDEKLARHLDAVRPFELAQLALDFRPSLFTSGFGQLFDRSSKKGAFLQPLDHLCGA
jgi:hypothetical protein